MKFDPDTIDRYRCKLRYKVCYHLGSFCQDVEDVVQETLTRYLRAIRDDKIRNPESIGAFLSGICNNVILEYRRRLWKELRRVGDVVVLGFTVPARLTRQSQELQELLKSVLQHKDTKVLIDLSRVSRIDSRGLGMLMACYAHAVKNQGMLKLLNPSTEVQNLLQLTRIDAVLETHYDERKALQSFQIA